MRDGVECETGIGILEDHGAKRGAVKRAICCDHTDTEPFGDRRKAGCAGGHDVARELVGIYPRGSQLLETASNHCFSRGYAAREADEIHASNASRTPTRVAGDGCSASD